MEKVNELKKQLELFRTNDWSIPKGIDKYELALECMDNIGCTDPEIRDDLILNLLWSMIVNKYLTEEQIKNILEISLSEKHLFYEIGQQNHDSVFNRSFTVLIITCIVKHHNNTGEDLLKKEEMIKAFENVIKYIKLEKDVRGYDREKGWAHAVAHSGDALSNFALSSYIKQDELLQILNVIKEKASIDYYVYKNMEMERLVTAIVNVISRDVISESQIIDWIRSFKYVIDNKNFPNKHYIMQNIKDLLRSLYFRLKYINEFQSIIDEIEIELNKINSTFNKLHDK